MSEFPTGRFWAGAATAAALTFAGCGDGEPVEAASPTTTMLEIDVADQAALDELANTVQATLDANDVNCYTDNIVNAFSADVLAAEQDLREKTGDPDLENMAFVGINNDGSRISGEVNYHPEFFNRLPADSPRAITVIYHENLHACVQPELEESEVQLVRNDGAPTTTYTNGLGIFIYHEDGSGKITQLTTIEEAAVTWLSYQEFDFDPIAEVGYENLEPYDNLYYQFEQFVQESNLTAEQVYEYLTNNDPFGMLAQRFGVERSEVDALRIFKIQRELSQRYKLDQ